MLTFNMPFMSEDCPRHGHPLWVLLLLLVGVSDPSLTGPKVAHVGSKLAKGTESCTKQT